MTPLEKVENLFTPDCIRTVSGQYVNVFNPDPATLNIEDIAHSLSMQVRFGGHLPKPYTVAQHCYMASIIADRENQLTALMHDASEAYLLDIPSPIKKRLTNYKKIENRLMGVLAAKFGFDYPFCENIHEVDMSMLDAEWNKIMIRDTDFFEIYTQEKAKAMFLNRYNQLKNK